MSNDSRPTMPIRPMEPARERGFQGAHQRTPAPHRRRRADTLAFDSQPAAPRSERVPCLTVMRGQLPGRLVRLPAGSIRIGRAFDNDVTLTDQRISRHHAVLVVDKGRVELVDAGSTNGTFVNEVRVGRTLLTDRSKFSLGANVTLRLDWLDADDREFQRRQFEILTRDPLTQCHNRFYLDEVFVHAASTAMRTKRPLSVVVFDLDHFKRVNDQWGHAVGDAVLRETAATLREHVRGSDVLARVGGEEFVMVLPDTPAPVAAVIAERVRAAVERNAHQLRQDVIVRVTASAGVADLSEVSDSEPEAVLALADARVFLAKAQGRNRVVTTGGEDATHQVWRMGTDRGDHTMPPEGTDANGANAAQAGPPLEHKRAQPARGGEARRVGPGRAPRAPQNEKRDQSVRYRTGAALDWSPPDIPTDDGKPFAPGAAPRGLSGVAPRRKTK